MPNVDASTAMPRYRAVHGLMGQRALSACQDCSDGGLAVALAEMCIGGRLGANIDLDAVPAMEDMTLTELLYSESASRLIVSVRPDLAMILDMLGSWQICRRIGTVTDDNTLTMTRGGVTVLQESVDDLTTAFKRTLDWCVPPCRKHQGRPARGRLFCCPHCCCGPVDPSATSLPRQLP